MKIKMLTIMTIAFLSATTANALMYQYEFGGIADWDEDEVGMLNLPGQVVFSGSFRVNTDDIRVQVNKPTDRYFEIGTSNFNVNIDQYSVQGNPGWAWGFSWDGPSKTNNGVVGSGGLAANFPLSDSYWYETWIYLYDESPLVDAFSGGHFSLLCGSLDEPSVGFGGDITHFTRHLVDDPSAPVPEPATLLLFGTALVGFAGSRFRRRSR